MPSPGTIRTNSKNTTQTPLARREMQKTKQKKKKPTPLTRTHQQQQQGSSRVLIMPQTRNIDKATRSATKTLMISPTVGEACVVLVRRHPRGRARRPLFPRFWCSGGSARTSPSRFTLRHWNWSVQFSGAPIATRPIIIAYTPPAQAAINSTP